MTNKLDEQDIRAANEAMITKLKAAGKPVPELTMGKRGEDVIADGETLLAALESTNGKPQCNLHELAAACDKLEAALRTKGVAVPKRPVEGNYELLQEHASELVRLGKKFTPMTATARCLLARSQPVPPAKPCQGGMTATQKVLLAKGLTSLDQLRK